jgi:hypothetical protein
VRVLHSPRSRERIPMHFTIVVPGLLDWPPSALAAVEKEAPALARLIAAAPSPAIEEDGLVAAACNSCGIAKQQDWPVAPWLARAAGLDTEDGYWLCAEPARFVVGHADVRFAGLVGDLEGAEADALIATLNAHFAGDGVRFVAPGPTHWFARVDPPPRLITRPPEVALGAPLFPYLAAGADAARWRRWQSETQMLLFEHAVNRSREQSGRAPVDSVWLWGGGTLVPRDAPAVRIFANGGLIRDLSRSTGLAPAPLPSALDATASAAAQVFWLDAIDVDAAARLRALDRAWLAPAERALNAGTIREVELVIAGRALALSFRVPRPSLVARWRSRFSSPRVASLLARFAADATRA